MVKINTTTSSVKYFLFYNELPAGFTKGIIQQLIAPIIHNEKADVLIDPVDKCFEIVVYTEQMKQILLKNPIRYYEGQNKQKICASLKSKKICKYQPNCEREQTCFFTHVSQIPCPLFSSKVRSWACKYWSSMTDYTIELPESTINVTDQSAIQVPSEFYRKVLPFPIGWDEIPSAPTKVPFLVLRNELKDMEQDSYYVYNWDGRTFILSPTMAQIPVIKKALRKLLNLSEKQQNNNKKSQQSRNVALPQKIVIKNNRKNILRGPSKKQEKKETNEEVKSSPNSLSSHPAPSHPSPIPPSYPAPPSHPVPPPSYSAPFYAVHPAPPAHPIPPSHQGYGQYIAPQPTEQFPAQINFTQGNQPPYAAPHHYPVAQQQYPQYHYPYVHSAPYNAGGAVNGYPNYSNQYYPQQNGGQYPLQYNPSPFGYQ